MSQCLLPSFIYSLWVTQERSTNQSCELLTLQAIKPDHAAQSQCQVLKQEVNSELFL